MLNMIHASVKTFKVSIAEVVFGIEIKGEGSREFCQKFKAALKRFIVYKRSPRYRIKVSYYKDKQRKPALDFTQKGKVLEIVASKKVLGEGLLWDAFGEKLTRYLYVFILSSENVMLLHSAACAVKDKGYLFLGPGNSGKTTVTELSKGVKVLSDDKTFIRRKGKHYYLYRTPLLGYEKVTALKQIKESIPIDKIFLLKKSKKVQFKKISKAGAMAAILARVKDLNHLCKQDIEKVFNMSYEIASSIDAYKMYFKKDNSFWQDIGRLKEK